MARRSSSLWHFLTFTCIHSTATTAFLRHVVSTPVLRPVTTTGAMLTSAAAAALDVALLASGMCLESLMECSGEAVALVTAATFPPSSHRRVVCVCGPGNNGADGFVAARHLRALGYDVGVVVAAQPSAARAGTEAARIWSKQLAALAAWDVRVQSEGPLPSACVYIDAIFGFSYKGVPTPPFDRLLRELAENSSKTVSIDVPSGWDVDESAPSQNSLQPAVLVSLTAPKPCSRGFRGDHWLGLRCVPPKLVTKFGLDSSVWASTSSPVVRLAPTNTHPDSLAACLGR